MKKKQPKPKKPRDTFIHKATGLEFIIPYNVTDTEAALLIRSHIKTKKKQLFESWKRQFKNKNWEGNEKEKTEELFTKHTADCLRLDTKIFLDVPNEKEGE